jgi:hypothetical protein
VLCPELKPFDQFVRVFIPMCTLDWWMGQGDGGKSTRYRGGFVIDALIEQLIYDYDIFDTPLFVLGGVRGSGVGALNNLRYVKSKLSDTTDVIGIADSSWYQDVETFSPAKKIPDEIYRVDGALRRASVDWMRWARVDSECDLYVFVDFFYYYLCYFHPPTTNTLEKQKQKKFRVL